MYRYDAFDQRIVDERVAQFRDQTRRHLAGTLSEDEFRPLRLQNGLYIQRHAPMLRDRDSLRPAVVAAAAQAGAHRAPLRPRLRPLHDAPEHPVQLAQARRDAPTSSPSSRRSRCTRSRPAATACATSPPTISPASRPTRSSIRVRSARSCASGRTFHPEFAYLPRKFKIAVNGAREDRAAIAFHDIGLHRDACAERRARLPRARRRRHGPHADHRHRDPRVPAVAAPAHLPRSDPARLQPLRPARQHPQGAHQDPGARRSASEEFARQVEAEWAHVADGPAIADRRGVRPRRGALRAARVRAGRWTSAIEHARPTTRVRALDRAQRAARTMCPATLRSRCR